MSLDRKDIIDRIGIERGSGCVVLTIADSWDWDNQKHHLKMLQDKINYYFEFVESGQISEAYPKWIGKPIVIVIIGRFPLPCKTKEFFEKAIAAALKLNIQIRLKYFDGELTAHP